MNPNLPLGILIPPISTIWSQNPRVTDNLHPLKQQWENHFNHEHLTSDYKQQQPTYHWVAHLLTVHPVQIHHPMFGLTPIVEPTTTSSNLTLLRTSLDETIVIPSITECANCRADCDRLQQIEHECQQNEILEQAVLNTLHTALTKIPIPCPTEADWVDQILYDLNQDDTNPEPTHGIPTPYIPAESSASRDAGNVSITPTTTESTPLSLQGGTTPDARPTSGNSNEQSTNDRGTDVHTLPPESPRGVQCSDYSPTTSWEIQGQTVYSAGMWTVCLDPAGYHPDQKTINPALLA
jgi:hypothetical protein